MSAGQTAEQVRQDSGGTLGPGQAAVSLASGAATSGLGMFGATLAQRLRIADVETMLAGAAVNPTARRGLVKQVVYGAAQEGFLEELPQSVQEQIAQNVATGKPLERGVDQAAVLGTLAGVVMGGGAQVVDRTQSRAARPEPPSARTSEPVAAAAAVPTAPPTPVTAVPTAGEASPRVD